MNAKRDKLAPYAEFMVNEFIPFVPEWCDSSAAQELFAQHDDLPDDGLGGGCPGWTDPRSNSLKMNRKTLGWSAAAAVFADGYGQLALLGYKLVGADQLVGGPWPDNEPAVSAIDWKSGEFNAKYYAVQMLANALGSGTKSFFTANVTTGGATPPAPAAPVGKVINGTCGHSDWHSDCNAWPVGSFNTTVEGITDLAGCVARVKRCNKANFASFSANHTDCAWYRSCPAWPQLEDPSIYETEVLHPAPPPPPAPGPLTVYPYQLHETQQRGMLLVCRVHNGCAVTLDLSGLGGGTGSASALVLEGVGPEPGFTKPVHRSVGEGGALQLGPFGIALVQ